MQVSIRPFRPKHLLPQAIWVYGLHLPDILLLTDQLILQMSHHKLIKLKSIEVALEVIYKKKENVNYKIIRTCTSNHDL